MKKSTYKLLTIFLSFSLANASCVDDNNDPSPGEGVVDTTTICRSPQEVGSYATFYKHHIGKTGDPMPFYNAEDGTYYIFYLLEHSNSSIRNHIFYTTTKDYADFEGFQETFSTGGNNDQDQWIGTGSFIKKDNLYYCFYTGHNRSLSPVEKIMLATSPDLKTWTKQSTATMNVPEGYDKVNFRDPSVYYDSTRSAYVMLITTTKDGKGILARYLSSDLKNWTLIDPLTDLQTDASILECPDIFKMGDKWYLVFSRINADQHRKTFYRVADNPNGPWKRLYDGTQYHETFDGLYLYAAKTAGDGNNRYISGWCSTGQEANSSNELDWGGAMITHKIEQQADGRLYSVMPEAVNNKFSKKIDYVNISSKGDANGKDGNYSITAQSDSRSFARFNRNFAPVKISMKIDASQSNSFGFAFGACDDMEETYSVLFDLTSTNRWGMPGLFMNKDVDNKESGVLYKNEINFNPLIVSSDKIFNIDILIEKSICVVYVSGNVAFTNRIYKMNQNPWTIFSENGTIKVSDLEIKI